MSALGMTKTVLATELHDAWCRDNREEMRRLGITTPPKPKFGPRVLRLLDEWARMLLANGSAVHIPASGDRDERLVQGYSLSSDRAAVVATDFYLRPVGDDTPCGTLLLLANEDAGVTQKGIYVKGDTFYTHWAPLPKFPPKGSK